MTQPRDDEPLEFVWYSLDEALTLLTDLVEARLTLVATRHLTGVVLLGEEIRLLQRKLELDGGAADDG